MNENAQFLKGSLSTIILQLLKDNKKMYGYEITKKVQELTAGKIQLTEGALYPALHKLETEGLLTVDIEMAGNRSRKYYSLTKKGRINYKQKIQSFLKYIEQMNTILQLNTVK